MNKRASGTSRFVRLIMVCIGIAFVVGGVMIVEYMTAGSEVLF